MNLPHATTPSHPPNPGLTPTSKPLLYLLLRPQLVGMPALLLPAIRRPRRQPSVAFPADHLVAVVLAGEGFERGFDDTAAETEDKVQC
jgi:hypothetical protein